MFWKTQITSIILLNLIVFNSCSTGKKMSGSGQRKVPDSGNEEDAEGTQPNPNESLGPNSSVTSGSVDSLSDSNIETLDPSASSASSAPSKSGNSNSTPAIPIRTAGLKTYNQISFSMASLTGVPPNAPGVAAEYAKTKGNLPTSNELKAVTPANISSATKLAAAYCNELTSAANANLRSGVFGNLDFSLPPAQAFANPEAIAGGLIDKFWGKNIDASFGDRAEHTKIIVGLIKDLAATAANTTVGTTGVAVGTCAAVLSAAPVLVY